MNKTATKVFCYIVLCCWGTACCDRRPQTHSILPAGITLKAGDVVLRCGYGFMSNAVLAADSGGTYSHIGIVVDSCGHPMIAHAVPGEPDFEGDKDRVKLDRPSVFYGEDRAKAGCVLRCKDSVAAGRAAVKAYKLYKQGMLFDHLFNTNDSTRMYCCEFIEDVYLSAGVSLTNGKRHDINLPGILLKGIILPSDFLHSNRLSCTARFRSPDN